MVAIRITPQSSSRDNYGDITHLLNRGLEFKPAMIIEFPSTLEIVTIFSYEPKDFDVTLHNTLGDYSTLTLPILGDDKVLKHPPELRRRTFQRNQDQPTVESAYEPLKKNGVAAHLFKADSDLNTGELKIYFPFYLYILLSGLGKLKE